MSTYQLAVNERRLLAEFPAFFHSFEEMLTELTQNVYRAGGSRMVICVNYDTRELIVHDDGPGVSDPATLFTAGQSGWDDTVTDPAGLGFFALLGMATEVTITSHTQERSWTATVTEACFDGAPIDSIDIAPDGGTGLHLHATLKDSVTIPTQLDGSDPNRYAPSPGFRQFYPIDVELTTIAHGESRTRDLPQPQIPGQTLVTAAGRIVRDEHHSGLISDPELFLIWEHRVLTNTKSGHDLMQALKALPDGAFVASGLHNYGLWLWIDTATQAVRPKLPDRREVILDEGYRAAINELAQELVQAAHVEVIRAQLAALDLPDVIPNVLDVEDQLATVDRPKFFGWSPEALLRLAGYHACTYTDFGSLSLYYIEDDGWQADRTRKTVWSRTALAAPTVAIADALCQEGIWAYAPETFVEDDTVQVRFVNYRGISQGAFAMGFAEAIVLEQHGQPIGTLTRWISDGADAVAKGLRFDGEAPSQGIPTLVWTREPRSVIAQYHRATPRDEMNAIKMAIEDFDGSLFWDYVYPDTDDEINDGAIAGTVIEVLATAFAPDALYDEQRWNTIDELSEQRRQLESAIFRMRRAAQDALEKHPELAAMLEPSMALAQQWEDAPWDIHEFEPQLAKEAS